MTTSSTASIAEEGGTMIINGPLTFDSVSAVYRQSHSGSADQSGKVELSGVSRVDSSGLALLLEWQANALAMGRKLEFANASSDLRRLAALCGASDLFSKHSG
jgi:phospholipid transport system transporter-binding protein